MPADLIRNETELEERLSRPHAGDLTAADALDGDVVVLGVGGKMGPSLVRRVRRAIVAAGCSHRVWAVSRFSERGVAEELAKDGIEIIATDLLDPGALTALPDVPNVIFMAGRKFGTSGEAHLTWAQNVYLPGLVAERYRQSRIVAFSTGNVYPLRPLGMGGATEETPPEPVGEYAQTALGRERMFTYGSSRYGTPVVLLRLNYAIDLRYGVLLDIGRAVFERRPVDVRMGLVNVIWQGDANSIALRALPHAQAPPLVLNLTGPETVSVRWIAEEFGRRLGITPEFSGEEAPTALLNHSARAQQLFGYPEVGLHQLIDWTTEWIGRGGATLQKPTHFQTRDGKF